ncbi:MAG: hypothetical protein JW955_04085 [Sedimentisphaerales bacterium]|nr:hypothetical protein [Sedimentisphaerales bacterium]
MGRSQSHPAAKTWVGILLLFGWVFPAPAALEIPDGWTPAPARLVVTDRLATEDKELVVETDEWKVIFSLFYNGGIYRLFDKVHDPNQQDNLVTGPYYCQGGLFDYDVYLEGDQEFSTALGKNAAPGRASLKVIENTPVRVRILQKCHPRCNNAKGPPGDPFVELDLVETTTEWTFYPTGRANLKFDAIMAPDWDGICSHGPGGGGKAINAEGNTVTAAHGTDFLIPWVTEGDTIESTSGGWGPVRITERPDRSTLHLASSVPSGSNLDFTIRRPTILDETFSIHADGDRGPAPHTSRWQGGSNGDPLFHNVLTNLAGAYDGDLFRSDTPPLADDYVLAHWTRSPRGFGSLLAFYEPFRGASYAVFNDRTWTDISYTQVARRGRRPFEEHHRFFQIQMGTENARIVPRIKSVADALPYADDYRHPYAQARVGTLLTGDGISAHGYRTDSGAYCIISDANTAAIAFDAARGGAAARAIPYSQPAVVVSRFDVADDRLRVELSQNNGITFEDLPKSWYHVTTRKESAQLGASDRRLLQLLCPIPAAATGPRTWVLRIRESAR